MCSKICQYVFTTWFYHSIFWFFKIYCERHRQIQIYFIHFKCCIECIVLTKQRISIILLRDSRCFHSLLLQTKLPCYKWMTLYKPLCSPKITLEKTSRTTGSEMNTSSAFLLLLLSRFSRVRLCDPVNRSTGLPCPSPIPGAYPNSCPLSRWCDPTISSFVAPVSSCFQFFPAPGPFPMSQLFTSGGQNMELQLQHRFFQRIFRVDFL